MLEQRFPSLAEFYRSRLRRYWVIRLPKEAIWWTVWFTRWHVVRPVVRALIPRRLLQHLYIIKAPGLLGLWRRWTEPKVPLVSLTAATAAQAGEIRTLRAPERVATPAPGAYPPESRAVLPLSLQAYEFPSLVLAELFDAEVRGCSNLVRSNGVIVHHDLYRFSHDLTSEELHGKIRIDPRKQVVKHYLKPKIRHELEIAASFTDACAQNYAHWLTEVLPRLNLFCRAASDAPIPLIVDAGLHANIEESLRAVAGDKAEIVRLGPDEAARVKRLLVTSPCGYIPFDCRGGAKSGHSHGIFSPYAFTLLNQHLDRVVENPVPALPTRIFLRRISSMRVMRNEPELEAKLVSRGFSAIQPECLSFAQQYQLFAHAEVIVGATGAGLANLVFCPKTARLIICISTHPEHAFGYWQNMAAALGNKVNYVFGPTVGPAAHGLHADFRVDLDAVMQALDDS